jgi:hypothetical protein
VSTARGLSRGDLTFAGAVAAVYLVTAALSIAAHGLTPDRMMIVAEQVLRGHLDSPVLAGHADTVAVSGRYYLALGPLQLLPYLPFAAIPDLQGVGRYAAGLEFGIPAGCLALPLMRAFGAQGSTAYWLASFTAFGTLLFFSSVLGNMYYLAHAESFLALTLFLIEWAGRRRPAVLGICLGASFLARPTTILAALPFGLYLVWTRRAQLWEAIRSVVGFGLPLGAAVATYGWFNWVRFGSVLESGYSISILVQETLEGRRALGLFSIAHVPENVRLALFSWPHLTRRFPFVIPDPEGMSMVLVSPALITAARAGWRNREAGVLWLAAVLVAVPVFLFYGGGADQYGFRYSLDFTPFLVALMALGSQRWTGRIEKALIVVSIGSVVFGTLYWATILKIAAP